MKQKYSEIIPKNREDFSYAQNERRIILNQIKKLLPLEIQFIHQAYFFAVVRIDRLIDTGLYPAEFYLKYKALAEAVWNNASLLTKNDDELLIIDLVKSFQKLTNKDYVFQNFIKRLENSYKDAARRGRILSKKELEEIQISVSEPWLISHLSTILPDIYKKDIIKFSKYGLPLKIADDMTDILEDVPLGFINVSQENIDKLKGIMVTDNCLKSIDVKMLDINTEYIKSEIQRAQKLYEEVDLIVEKIIQRNPKSAKVLYLWKDFCHSWIEETKERYNL